MATKRVTTSEKKTTAPKRVRSTKTAANDNVVAADAMMLQPDPGEIARRAYELFQSRGMTHGRDVDDWLAAERELMQR